MTVSARATVVAVSVSATLLLAAAIKQPIRKPTYDPAIPVVELFDAIDGELVEVTVIARNSHEANLFVTNKSSAAVSVHLPQTVGAIHVLKQFISPGANSGPAVGQGQSGFGMGQGQPVGGGVQNSGNTGPGNFNNLPGNSIFSIPSQKTVQLPLKTVCLAYGRPDPLPKMQYRLVRVDDVARDAPLKRVLERYVAGEVDQQVAQAAVWHLGDRMSWKTLAEKRVGQIAGLPGEALFTAKQLDAARQLVDLSREETAKVAGTTQGAASAKRSE